MTRATNEAAYENATTQWEESGGIRGFAPVDPDVDNDRFAFTVARIIGCSALELDSIPLHYLGSAHIEIEVRRQRDERAERRAREARKKRGR